MNILIVGLGSIAHKHIAALNNLNRECNIYALRSSKNSESQPNIINLYSIDEAKQISFTFVIISNPTSKHKGAIIDLISLNCPLFIEKPLYHQLDIDDVIEKIQSNNILTYIACNLRFLDSLVFLKKVLSEGKKRLNEVNIYSGSYLPEWRSGDYKMYYSAIPELGGGVHLDLIHEIDYAYWLFGPPETVQSVLCNRSTLGIKAVDYANYNLIYDNFCTNITLNYYRRDYKRNIELVFEDTTWSVDIKTNTIQDISGRDIFSSDQSILDTYTAQMRYFLSLVKNRSNTSMNDIHIAYEVLQICLHNKNV